MHFYIKLAFFFSPSNQYLVPTKRVKKKSGTHIIARFSDNYDSTILKFLKYLTKLLCTNSIVLFCLLVAILH